MHAPHQEGRARPSLFFVLDLRLSSMDSVGVHTLGSAAAQGGQDTSSEHANGSPFTGWDLFTALITYGKLFHPLIVIVSKLVNYLRNMSSHHHQSLWFAALWLLFAALDCTH